MSTWSSCQSVNVPVIHGICIFTSCTCYGNPNSQFESFVSVHGLCAPYLRVMFLIPFIYLNSGWIILW